MKINLEILTQEEIETLFQKPVDYPDSVYPLVISGYGREVVLKDQEVAEIWRQGFAQGKVSTLLSIWGGSWEDEEPEEVDLEDLEELH